MFKLTSSALAIVAVWTITGETAHAKPIHINSPENPKLHSKHIDIIADIARPTDDGVLAASSTERKAGQPGAMPTARSSGTEAPGGNRAALIDARCLGDERPCPVQFGSAGADSNPPELKGHVMETTDWIEIKGPIDLKKTP